jgi:Glycosyl hydrolase family 53
MAKFNTMEKADITRDKKVSLYDKLVATHPDAVRKGATMPYTSLNGHMYSYKQVMICEAVMPENDPATAEAFLKDLIARTRSVSNGLGVFYWEPESYNNWQGYTMGSRRQP